VLTAELISACPPALRPALARYLAGDASGEITLMHFGLKLGDADALGHLLEAFIVAAPARQELVGLQRLFAVNIDHLAQVGALCNDGLVSIPLDGGDRVAAIRQQFDRAVALAPEASVALYSLGSAGILDRATGEIVNRLAEWGLLRSDLTVLDIGCGIGRIERALALRVKAITAIDVSSGMIAEARRRCRDLPDVTFAQCDGRDLAEYQDRSYDLVLAVDSFPYLFAADPAIIDRHFWDCGRILRPGGAIVILNFSYRGDAAVDRHDVAELAGAYGFTVERAGTQDFTLWDGLTFLLTLPVRRE
jgi:SAM-dependent methyltransferase